jgi:predicted nucleic acid-binding protein
MKALIDTYVIVDVLERREPFFHDSYRLLQCAVEGKLEAVMSAGSVTDVYYIISRSIHNAAAARQKIIGLSALVNFRETLASDINSALTINMVDDGGRDSAHLILPIGKRPIGTYDGGRFSAPLNPYFSSPACKADFENSPVPAISPALMLRQFM